MSMEAISPVYAALGIVDFDALNDLAGWLDGSAGSAAEPLTARSSEGRVPEAGRSPGRKS